jgi:hypothetical protein
VGIKNTQSKKGVKETHQHSALNYHLRIACTFMMAIGNMVAITKL